MLHFIRMDAGRRAGTALDAEANTLPARDGANLLYKRISPCFSCHKPLSRQRGLISFNREPLTKGTAFVNERRGFVTPLLDMPYTPFRTAASPAILTTLLRRMFNLRRNLSITT